MVLPCQASAWHGRSFRGLGRLLRDEDRGHAPRSQRLLERWELQQRFERAPARRVATKRRAVERHPAVGVAPLDAREVTEEQLLAVLAAESHVAIGGVAAGELVQLT